VKRSTKAALLSALVFPGVGHLYLKRYVIGIFLSGGAASATYFIVSSVVSKAFVIAEKIQSESLSLDVNAIASLVSEQSHGAVGSSMSIATIALIVFWIIGIIDSYRQGRVDENANRVTSLQENMSI
jgi:predicted histidine transporter YuiF (NhaC family)